MKTTQTRQTSPRMKKFYWFITDDMYDYLPKRTPEWVSSVLGTLIEEPSKKALCFLYGHKPVRDQCGMPEHDHCLWCRKSLPFMADTPTSARVDWVMRHWRPGSKDEPWTWEDEEQDLLKIPCPTVHARSEGIEVEECDDPEPGCYQRKLESWLREQGEVTQPICLGTDGRVWDGHHRLVAAKRLGFERVPIE